MQKCTAFHQCWDSSTWKPSYCQSLGMWGLGARVEGTVWVSLCGPRWVYIQTSMQNFGSLLECSTAQSPPPQLFSENNNDARVKNRITFSLLLGTDKLSHWQRHIWEETQFTKDFHREDGVWGWIFFEIFSFAPKPNVFPHLSDLSILWILFSIERVLSCSFHLHP